MVQDKTDYIWFNGDIIRWEDAKIHVMSHVVNYGTSVFEGIRSYNSHKGPVIFRHKDHIKRLFQSAKIYRFPISYSIEDLMVACRTIIIKNNIIDAYIRPLVLINNIGVGVNLSSEYTTDVVIAAFPYNSYFGSRTLEHGINVMISSWNRFAPNTISTIAKAGGNYLSSLLIGGEARRNGYDEGIALDINGYVSEGASENIFKVKNNVLFTPPLTSSVLPGITRDTIIKLAKNMNIEIYEQILSRESLYIADELFISGTAAEITPVHSIDGIKIGNGLCGSITKRIQKKFFGLFMGTTYDEWGWLDLVNQ